MKNHYISNNIKRAGLCSGIAALLIMYGVNVLAQVQSDTAEEKEQTKQLAEKLVLYKDIPIMDSSEEQGQVSMEDSFGTLSPRDAVLAQRKKAFQDTKVNAQLRSYYLDRNRFDGSESEAMALGGSIGFKTGYFRERFSLGATAFTSQRLYGPEDKGGTNLLAPVQQGYTVLGELYGQYRVSNGIMIDLGRKGINTTFINESDSRMTPNTFQFAALQGEKVNSNGTSLLRFGFGYVDKIKEQTSEKFISMATAAGVAEGIDRGVYVGGANFQNNFQKSQISIGAVNYFSDDILNIFYTEVKYSTAITESIAMQFATQYIKQNSVGADLQFGSPFSTNQIGLKAELDWNNALFTTSWNRNSSSADLQSPWGSIPSYNSVQVEDFNLAGVDSFLIRAAYKFKSVPGLSAHTLWVNGSQPSDPTKSAQDEYDFNIKWQSDSGRLKGLSVQVRYALVTQEMGGPNLNDFRLIFYYDPPSL